MTESDDPCDRRHKHFEDSGKTTKKELRAECRRRVHGARPLGFGPHVSLRAPAFFVGIQRPNPHTGLLLRNLN